MFRIRKRLKKDGSLVETNYCLCLNNEEPMYFPNRDALRDYLQKYREQNEIFNLQLFRIETYSL